MRYQDQAHVPGARRRVFYLEPVLVARANAELEGKDRIF